MMHVFTYIRQLKIYIILQIRLQILSIAQLKELKMQPRVLLVSEKAFLIPLKVKTVWSDVKLAKTFLETDGLVLAILP